jgi:hypothetical protein
MTVDFTPDFDGSDIEMLAYALIGNNEYAFEAMNKDACAFMDCPVSNGVNKNYTFNVLIDQLKPSGVYTVQWRMKQKGVVKCCFQNGFKIVQQ